MRATPQPRNRLLAIARTKGPDLSVADPHQGRKNGDVLVPFPIVDERRARYRRGRLVPCLDGRRGRRFEWPGSDLRPFEQYPQRRVDSLNFASSLAIAAMSNLG